MSLYNMLFGENPDANRLLDLLDIDKIKVGRFRDSYIEDQGHIVFYTRNGGKNRDHWNEELKGGEQCFCPGCIIHYHLPKHHFYITDLIKIKE